MFQNYVLMFVLGCSISKTDALTVSNDAVHCHTSTNCIRNVFCNTHLQVEWLYPNSSSITTTNQTIKISAEYNILRYNNPGVSDAGVYTCRLLSNTSINATTMLIIIVDPTFVYSNTNRLYDTKVAIQHDDIFINCTVQPDSVSTFWEYQGDLLDTSNGNKYRQNTSGLIIHNATSDDEGEYICIIGNVNPLQAFILLSINWPPESISPQNLTVLVNISEQVILNCSVSSSPDPVYNWSIPDTCSSCPQHYNYGVLIFTANITDSGEYICVAKNQYGNISQHFTVHILSRPVMNADPDPIFWEQRANIILTCGVQYAYPAPNIKWNITTPLLDVYIMQDESTASPDYKLHSNGSIEIYDRFLFEEHYLIVICSATNTQGSGENKFHLQAFIREQKLQICVTNLTNCQSLTKDTQLFEELENSLRRWFTSVCNCNGNDNLLNPELTCLDKNRGSITSTVRNEGLHLSVDELIDLTSLALQKRNPSLSNGWILHLNSMCANKLSTKDDNLLAIIASIGGFCAIVAFVLCVAVAMLFVMRTRPTTKYKSKKKKEVAPHVYDEINKYSTGKSNASVGKKTMLRDDIIFDDNDKTAKPPAYQTLSTSECKRKCSKSNDYIELSVERKSTDKNSQANNYNSTHLGNDST